jgi:hypothetical protein
VQSFQIEVNVRKSEIRNLIVLKKKKKTTKENRVINYSLTGTGVLQNR